jgi:selT/selW/selH-like putative selenoprotein
LKKELGIDSELIKGRGGVFDVVADGKTVYSKHSTGRFPEEDEIMSALRALM